MMKAGTDSGPLISVIMPVFNHERFVGAAIESILEQTYANFELLIVDDCSHDGSADIIRTFAKRDNRIWFRILERNGGVAVARNLAIEQSSGEYIVTMDSDDVSLPTRLEKQLSFLQENPDIDVVGTWKQAVDENLKPRFVYDTQLSHPFILLHMFIGLGIAYITAMYRRKALLDMGCYDPSVLKAEDVELFFRLVKRMKLANIPEKLVLYRMHGKNKSFNRTAEEREQAWDLRRRAAKELLGEAPEAMMRRFSEMRRIHKLSWNQRRLARRDIVRLIDGMIAAKWVEASDRDALIAEMKRKLQHTMPRRWLQFLHWYRHHVPND